MAGKPLRRARAAAAGDASEEALTSRLPKTDISPVACRDLSLVEKLQAFYGLSLDATRGSLIPRRRTLPHRCSHFRSPDVMMIRSA